MNEIIALSAANIGGEQIQTVNARDLHAFLGVKTEFKDWIARRIKDFGFVENTDFCSFLSESRPQMWGQVFGRVSFEMRPFPPPPDAGTNRNRLTHF